MYTHIKTANSWTKSSIIFIVKLFKEALKVKGQLFKRLEDKGQGEILASQGFHHGNK